MGIETNLRNPKELPQSNTYTVSFAVLKYTFGSPGQFIEVLIHLSAFTAILALLYSSIWPLLFFHHLDCFWGFVVRAASIMAGWTCLSGSAQKLLLYRYAPHYRIRACKNVDQVVNMRMRVRMILPQGWWFTVIVALYQLYLNIYIKTGCTALCCDEAPVPQHYFDMTTKERQTNVEFKLLSLIYFAPPNQATMACAFFCYFVYFVYNKDHLEEVSLQAHMARMREMRSIHGGG
jgi:hypothetical protein